MKEANKLERLFKRILREYKSLMTSEQLEKLDVESCCVMAEKLRYCVVCKEWEPSDNFYFDENLNLYKCGIWSNCSNYDDYYTGCQEI